jgi:hypothetical protein
MKLTLRAALLGGLVIGIGGAPAWAQQPRQPDGNPAATAPGATMREGSSQTERREGGERSNVVEPSALESGANSFTEGQARARFEEAGFTDLQDLRKDDAGFWRARGTQGGSTAEVAMDFRGRIASGPGVANLGTGSRGAGRETTGASTGSGRAENASRPDGAPGNPPGTAAGRAVDRATGANTTGADSAARPDGAPGNPPSTAAGRAVDRAQGETPRPDGTPGNPAGTAAGRAIDRATGADTTGANPGAPATSGGGQTR